MNVRSRKKRGFVAALMILTAVCSVAAQDGSGSGQTPSESDIFNTGSFDQTVQQSKQQDKTDSLSYLVGGTMLFDSSVTAPWSFDGYASDGYFAGRLFGKVTVPRFGRLYLAYNLEHTIFAGESGSLSAAGLSSPTGTLADDLFTVSYALSEFFFDFDIAKTLFIRVGNQLIAWGPSNVWTPVDFINLERTSLLEPIDIRVGKPGLKLFLPFRSADITLFTDFSNTVTSGKPGDLAKTANLAVRGAATLGGFEFGFSSYLGQSVQNRYGFDFSGRALATNIYGELGVGFAYGAYEFEYAYSLGFSRALGDLKRWTIQGEFFYNSAGTGDTTSYPALLSAGSFSPLYVGRIYGYAALSKDEFLASFIKLTLSGLVDGSDSSYQGKLQADFSIPGFLPFTASLGYSGGGPGKAFTWFSGDSALTLDFQVLVQF